jgi:hypothetical protein
MLFACRLVADYPKCEKEGVDSGVEWLLAGGGTSADHSANCKPSPGVEATSD